MGKSSKSKSKKSAKQERALHLKNVEVYEKTIFTLDEKLSTLGITRKRERIILLEEELQLSLNMEEAYAFVNRYPSYKLKLSRVCSDLLFNQISSDNYIQALNAYNKMMNYPLTDEFRCCIKPISNLLLSWKDNIDRKDTIEREARIRMIGKDAIDIIVRSKAMNRLQLLFLSKAMIELSRCSYLFEVVETILITILMNAGEHKYTNQWVTIPTTFSVYSYIDEFRCSLIATQEQVKCQKFLRKIRKINWIHLCNELPCSTGHLAQSLLEYYTLIFEQEELSLESAKAVAKKSIESLEKYITLRTTAAQYICCTCKEADTQEYESLVCQGCRVISYCCKYHQRLNYLHHEETGTRGLGHKQLCPVFKAYRRKEDNADTSKKETLDRKFHRACKRFLRETWGSF